MILDRNQWIPCWYGASIELEIWLFRSPKNGSDILLRPMRSIHVWPKCIYFGSLVRMLLLQPGVVSVASKLTRANTASPAEARSI
ncbi:MAG: hypothetical protein AAGG81_09235, partial [Chlamydiota bacterium]